MFTKVIEEASNHRFTALPAKIPAVNNHMRRNACCRSL